MAEEQIFNQKSKTINSSKAVALGVTYQVSKIIFAFVYRTLFIMVLSADYLGIEGLFVNVLSILSIAELGIGSIIAYRLYKPIKDNDVEKVARLMNFYRIVYLGIAGVVLLVGLIILPLIPYLINSTSTIPGDINIYVIYSIYLARSVTSYFFVYKQSLLSADQKNYVISIFDIIVTFSRYAVEIALLFLTRNYTLILLVGMLVQLAANYIISLVITKKYKSVFKCRLNISKEEKKSIFKDAGSMLCHKISGAVINSTDSILLSIFIGITTLGLYSNYSMIITAVSAIVVQLFSSFISSIGKLHIENNTDKTFDVYSKLQFANHWVAGFCAIAYFCLFTPFITVWLGSSYLLNWEVVLCLCVSQYININRFINGAFVNATGLFVKDKIRAAAEAVINLVASILLVRKLGIAGIFVGTIISSVTTVFWREPMLVHKYVLKRHTGIYWLDYLYFTVLTVATCIMCYVILSFIPNTIGYVILKFCLITILVNVVFCIFNCRSVHLKFWIEKFKLALSVLRRKMKRS